MVEERRIGLRIMLVWLDAMALVCLWWAFPFLRDAVVSTAPMSAWTDVFRPVELQAVHPSGLLVVPIWLAVLHVRGAHRQIASHVHGWRLLAGASAVALALVVTVLYLLRQPHLSRTVLVGFAIVSVPVLRGVRVLAHGVAQRLPRVPRRVIFVGPEPALAAGVARCREEADWQLEVVARIVPDERGTATEQVVRALRRDGAHEVRVTGTFLRDFHDLAALCAELGMSMSVEVPPDMARPTSIDGHAGAISFRYSPMYGPSVALKRVGDVLGAAMLLLAVAPLLVVAAALIYVVDGGPVLFSQRRAGLHGAPFTMYKLRTMVRDAEAARAGLEPFNQVDGPAFKMQDDPRITWWGRILRRWSVDELPQLWHVLRGEMSLVGPRPALPDEVARYQRWQRRRLSMRPGLTCTWQVSGRSDIDFDRWMEMDLDYIDRWTPLLDVWLLVRTIPAVLWGTGAR